MAELCELSQMFSPGSLYAIEAICPDEIAEVLDSISQGVDDILQPMADSEEQVSSTQADDDAEPQASTADAPYDAQPGTSAAGASGGDPSSSAQPEPLTSQAAEEKPSRAELVARARNLQQTLKDRREQQETQAVVKQVQHALDTHPDRDLKLHFRHFLRSDGP